MVRDRENIMTMIIMIIIIFLKIRLSIFRYVVFLKDMIARVDIKKSLKYIILFNEIPKL